MSILTLSAISSRQPWIDKDTSRNKVGTVTIMDLFKIYQYFYYYYEVY